MKKSLAIAGIAAGMILSAGAVMAPTAHADNYDALGKRYLRAACPVNKAQQNIAPAWGGRTGRIAYGTPVPQAARQAYRDTAKKAARASRVIRQGAWPKELRSEADRMSRYYFAYSSYLRSRDTATVSRSWEDKSSLPSSKWASDEIRYTLGLPPRGRGCN